MRKYSEPEQMMSRLSAFLTVLLLSAVFFVGCKEKVKPVSERIAKSWLAQVVKEGSATVYDKDQTSSAKPGYANFKLSLTSSGTVTYTEFEGNTFTGTWKVEGDNKLILSGLTPEPSGTGGVIEFTINTIEDKKLVLTNLKPSLKTGNTINNYTLYLP